MIIWENKDIPSKRLKCKVVVSVKIWFRVVSVNSGVLCEGKTILYVMRKGVENDFFIHKSYQTLYEIKTLNINTNNKPI